MTFTKYKIANDVIANLDAGIGTTTTSIVLNSGDGDLFPTTGDAIIKFVQYNTPADPTSGIAKSENILMTARSGDTLTVTRGYGGDTPTIFNANDYVYLTNHTDVIEDVQDEVERLETAKLNQDGELRTGNGAWKISYNDGSGNETELSLGNANTYMKSNGTSLAPEFSTPPLDINGQSLENGELEEADEIAFYDNSALTEKKRNAKSTNAREGLIRIATDGEASTGTSEVLSINPKQAKDNYDYLLEIGASDDNLFEAETEQYTSATSYTKIKEVECGISGTYRIKFNLFSSSGFAASEINYGQVFKNGIAYGTERSNNDTPHPGTTYTEDLAFNKGDLIQLYFKKVGGTPGTRDTGIEHFIGNGFIQVGTIILN